MPSPTRAMIVSSVAPPMSCARLVRTVTRARIFNSTPFRATALRVVFADFAALPSAQGLVIAPYADDLSVAVTEARVTIARPGGMALTPPQMPVASSPAALANATGGPSYLDLARWGMPTLITRLFSGTKPAARHRQVQQFDDVAMATVESISEDKNGDPRAFPVQVDGDYIGDRTRVALGVDPGALTIVA